MSKRKFDQVLDEDTDEKEKKILEPPKHSLDSDEEDDEVNEANYNILEEDDIEGLEDAPLSSETKIGFTAFNLDEELEEGHFDKDGHYLWKKEKEVRDHWVDNIDSIEIKKNADGSEYKEPAERGLGDSDSEDEKDLLFNPKELYKKIVNIVQPGETISKALSRLGKGRAKISSAERWKRKKAGVENTDSTAETIIELTSLANELLTRTGNIEVYEETYEGMSEKIGKE